MSTTAAIAETEAASAQIDKIHQEILRQKKSIADLFPYLYHTQSSIVVHHTTNILLSLLTNIESIEKKKKKTAAKRNHTAPASTHSKLRLATVSACLDAYKSSHNSIPSSLSPSMKEGRICIARLVCSLVLTSTSSLTTTTTAHLARTTFSSSTGTMKSSVSGEEKVGGGVGNDDLLVVSSQPEDDPLVRLLEIDSEAWTIILSEFTHICSSNSHTFSAHINDQGNDSFTQSVGGIDGSLSERRTRRKRRKEVANIAWKRIKPFCTWMMLHSSSKTRLLRYELITSILRTITGTKQVSNCSFNNVPQFFLYHTTNHKEYLSFPPSFFTSLLQTTSIIRVSC